MASATGPLVSIVIPAFEAQRWIGETLRSALAQTWPATEIVVVDDGSRDRTFEIARRFASARVKVVRQDNRGAAAARNQGLSLAQGDYIQWLDADDLMDPGKLAAQVRAAREAGDRVLLSAAFGEFHLLPRRARFVQSALWQDLEPVEFLLAKFGGNLWMNPAVWLVSRRLSAAAGPWDERLSLDDDGEYFARVVAASERIRFVPQARVYYRRAHGGSLSRDVSDRAARSLLQALRSAIAQLIALEDSARTRRAALALLQSWVDLGDCFHPDRAALARELQVLAAQLGGELRPPALGWKYRPLQRLFGWRAVRRVKSMVADLKLRARVERERLLQRSARGGDLR